MSWAAFGLYTTAQPYASFVIGKYNEISGTTSTWVSTDPLFVIGNGASAGSPNNAVTVLKNGNVGIGTSSPTAPLQVIGNATFGQWNVASGDYAAAFGILTTASGDYAAAFGQNTIASGTASASFGITTEASGDYAAAFGQDTTASGDRSATFGDTTIASGHNSAAFGGFTNASGISSTSFGLDTNAQPYASVVIGKYNEISGTETSWVSTDPLFVIGNGEYGSPNNAVTVLKNGNVGIGASSPSSLLEIVASGTTLGLNVTNTGTGDSFIINDASADTTPFVVDSSGNVGIGTSSPNDILSVEDTDLPQISVTDTSSPPVTTVIRSGNNNGLIGTTTDDDLKIITNDSERMRITDTGNVGIGTSSPSEKLDVNGDAIADSWLTHSSQKWKKDITPLDGTLDKVIQIQGVSYNWKADEFPEMAFDENTIQIGLIAEQLETIYPELVHTSQNGDKSIDYSKLTPVLIEAIKEQQEIVTEQQQELADQKDKFTQQQDIIEQLKTVICPDNPQLSACQ